MLVARTILFTILGLNCLSGAEELLPSPEITRFVLSPSYGFSKSADSVSGKMSKYLLWELDDDSEFDLIDSVISSSKPQICDSNAVSFIVALSPDSAMLMVKELDSSTPPDTIITYPTERLTGSFSWAPGEGHLYNLNDYLFFRPDSLLFWSVPNWRRSIIEFGRILPDGSYDSEDGCFECSLPRLTGDLSMALYIRYAGAPIFQTEVPTLVWAYDFAGDSSYVLRRVKGECGSPQLLHKDDQLYCICHQSLDIGNLCVVEDSIPRTLFSIEYPVSFVGYDLYQDSIVIRTANGCDKDYGIQTHVIQR